LKDRAAGPEPHDAPAGEGILDFPAIVRAARSVGVEWYIAEQDEPRDELKDILSAHGYLVSLAAPAA
jgi:sugar phosphate isomerase/epimerase